MSETATGVSVKGANQTGGAAGNNSFVVVANRLPVDMITEADGTKTWQASPGGLVSALSPVLEKHQAAGLAGLVLLMNHRSHSALNAGYFFTQWSSLSMTMRSSMRAFLMPRCGRCITI